MKFNFPPFEIYEWTAPGNLCNYFSENYNCKFIPYHLGRSLLWTRLLEVSFWVVHWSWLTVASWGWECHLFPGTSHWHPEITLWKYSHCQNQEMLSKKSFNVSLWRAWMLNFYQHITDIKNAGEKYREWRCKNWQVAFGGYHKHSWLWIHNWNSRTHLLGTCVLVETHTELCI